MATASVLIVRRRIEAIGIDMTSNLRQDERTVCVRDIATLIVSGNLFSGEETALSLLLRDELGKEHIEVRGHESE